MSGIENVHATGILLGGHGVLVRGPSGSGKSLLALALLDEWESRRLPGVLVADDRVDLDVENERLTMKTPKTIAGLIELRGRGILSRPFHPSASVDLVVDLVETLERMPEAGEFTTRLCGVAVPRCPVPRVGVIDVRHQLLLVGEALREIASQSIATVQKTT